VSITLDVHFCLEALEEAIALYGPPEIMNTDQGSQFTPQAFTGLLKEHGIRISMDGKGAWRDNVFVERLWRRSSTKKCIFMPTIRSLTQKLASVITSICIIEGGHTPA